MMERWFGPVLAYTGIFVLLTVALTYIIRSERMEEALYQIRLEYISLEAKYEYEKSEHARCLSAQEH
jgi:hypothetical protein